MLFFLILSFTLFVYYAKNKQITLFLFIFYVLSLIVFMLRATETVFGDLDWFISDEKYYANSAKFPIDTIKIESRVLWSWINNIIYNYDFFGEVGVKLINIPIFAYSLIVLTKTFNLTSKIIWIAMLTPYIFVMTTYNFRDPLVFLVVILLILAIYSNHYIKIITFSIALFFLRQELLLVIFPIILFLKIRSTFSGFKLRKNSLFFLLSFSLFILFTYDFFLSGFISSKLNWLNFKFIDNYEATLEARNAFVLSDNQFLDFSVGVIRYMLAPNPLSLLNFYLSEGSDLEYGHLEILIRIFNQTVYFLLIFYLLMKPKLTIKTIKSLEQPCKLILMVLFSYAVIYGIYSLGTGHQRIKIPFQIGIVLISILVYSRSRLRIN